MNRHLGSRRENKANLKEGKGLTGRGLEHYTNKGYQIQIGLEACLSKFNRSMGTVA